MSSVKYLLYIDIVTKSRRDKGRQNLLRLERERRKRRRELLLRGRGGDLG